ncbi:hypothetical protein ADL26_07885 [Thermoactinomyces vulgaris]|jgi:hypothetical protein|nr:hypothetical protein ADL26_07885 [Thermoactinomyces vulgaris]
MSIQHIALVLEAAGLGPQEKAVLTAFCNHTDPNGKTFAGQERLMREAGMPESTFKRWRSELVKRNLLFSQRKGRKGGGRTTSDTYVNLAALRAMRDPFFGEHPTDRPEDENPFADVNSKLTGNEPVSEPKGGGANANPQVTGNEPVSELKECNGLASEPINRLASEPTVGSPASPITLINRQGEPSPLISPTEPKASAAPVARIREGGEAAPKKQGDPGLLIHSLVAVELFQKVKAPGIEGEKVIEAIERKLEEGLDIALVRKELLRPLPSNPNDLTAIYLGRLNKLGTEPAVKKSSATAPVRADAHAYVDDYGSCETCGLPEANPRHRVLAAVPAA